MGPVLIHAGLYHPYDEEWEELNAELKGYGIDAKVPLELDIGGFIGIAEIDHYITDGERPWYNGELGIVLKNARPMRFFPYKGQVGLMRVPDADVRKWLKAKAGE